MCCCFQIVPKIVMSCLRRRAAGLFSAALDASNAVHLAIDTEAAKGTKALDRLVAKHDCVAEEEALRSHIFISLLNAEQS